MKNLLLLLACCCAMATAVAQKQINHFEYQETVKNDSSHHISRLLVVATGNMFTRKVADDLRYALDKQCSKRKVEISFQYLNHYEDAGTIFPMKPTEAALHDAVLLIRPDDSTSTALKQVTGFMLFKSNNVKTPIWTAKLAIKADLSSSSYFNYLALKLIQIWKANKIFLGSHK
ncbi:hypothetical protein ACE38W_11160 [Chitinophaga sp. Hz27]|uniref:hypothetical protein n=1 Tax=Chitinophaga sp. Hz27 TaxID=3347169 RepID=UPI0035D6958A